MVNVRSTSTFRRAVVAGLNRYTPQLHVVTAQDRWFPYEFAKLPEYIDQLRSKLRIAVIYGGDKTKDGSVIYKTVNPRPWKSYEIVAGDIQRALQEIGFQNVYMMPDDMSLPQRLQQEKIHMAWLNSGGVQGFDPLSHAPAMLEMLGIPYVGHEPFSSAMLDSKPAFKRELHSLGIDTAPFMTWHPAQGSLDLGPNSRFSITFNDYTGPFVIKPSSGRASLNVEVVMTAEDLPPAAEHIFSLTNNTILIEPYLSGREFCVSVMGQVVCAGDDYFKMSAPFAFSIVERVLEKGEAIFTSMDMKAITRDRMRNLKPEDNDLKQRLIDLAQTIYWDLNLRSLIRVDVRADSNGVLHVLEANPKPDLKRPTESGVTSLVFAGLEETGLSYTDLVHSLLADRLDYLFMYNVGMIQPIINLLS